MTPRPRKPWTKLIEESGIAVRLYEREPGSLLYREVRLDGAKDRKSLGHRDRTLAERQAVELARRIAELRLTGHTGSVTLGHLWRLYQKHRLPLLKEERRQHVGEHASFFLAHFGERFPLEDLSQSHVDAFAQARRSGALHGKRKRPGVRDWTIRTNLMWLSSMLRWATTFKINGRRVLASNPIAGCTLPREKNVRRPVANELRYRLTMAKADEADPSGRLACILAIARYTGRRVNAIGHLRASDVLLSQDTITRALAAHGDDPGLVRHMPHGALRWRPEHDKLGYEDIAPLSVPAREALERYLRVHPTVGDAWLFPQRKHADRAITKVDAYLLLRRAEELAKLPKLDRGAFHPYRRLWAVERKHLPDVDVARGGGWRDLATMKLSYQQPDPATTLRAIENDSSGHTSDTAPKANDERTTA